MTVKRGTVWVVGMMGGAGVGVRVWMRTRMRMGKRQWIRVSVALEGGCGIKWSDGVHGGDRLCRDDDVGLCSGIATCVVTVVTILVVILVIVILVDTSRGGSSHSGR